MSYNIIYTFIVTIVLTVVLFFAIKSIVSYATTPQLTSTPTNTTPTSTTTLPTATTATATSTPPTSTTFTPITNPPVTTPTNATSTPPTNPPVTTAPSATSTPTAQVTSTPSQFTSVPTFTPIFPPVIPTMTPTSAPTIPASTIVITNPAVISGVNNDTITLNTTSTDLSYVDQVYIYLDVQNSFVPCNNFSTLQNMSIVVSIPLAPSAKYRLYYANKSSPYDMINFLQNINGTLTPATLTIKPTQINSVKVVGSYLEIRADSGLYTENVRVDIYDKVTTQYVKTFYQSMLSSYNNSFIQFSITSLNRGVYNVKIGNDITGLYLTILPDVVFTFSPSSPSTSPPTFPPTLSPTLSPVPLIDLTPKLLSGPNGQSIMLQAINDDMKQVTAIFLNTNRGIIRCNSSSPSSSTMYFTIPMISSGQYNIMYKTILSTSDQYFNFQQTSNIGEGPRNVLLNVEPTVITDFVVERSSFPVITISIYAGYGGLSSPNTQVMIYKQDNSNKLVKTLTADMLTVHNGSNISFNLSTSSEVTAFSSYYILISDKDLQQPLSTDVELSFFYGDATYVEPI